MYRIPYYVYTLVCFSDDCLPSIRQLHTQPVAQWTSGSPRMLLVLVREFESRRGEILNLFAKKKEKRINC